ncbi:MAG: KpsF/GutQ family sugar-phosphate isomerase [Salinivirgaceae bacterium]|nr:KpsF/GutQ family sugar-phosphate isomerase [Salinivirgaceae bacterium]
MKTNDEITAIATDVIEQEAATVANLKNMIDNNFAEAVSIIFKSRGRLVVTGIGKSAIIAQKIVATMNSTGTPALFMHAADAIHGDLGMIQDNDIVMLLSRSGNTPEIKVLVPILKMRGNRMIAMVSDTQSYLAQQADIIINAYAAHEACPNNLAPTSSTTAQLVMGDALAIALLECRGFSPSDFAKYHPGGALGKKLYMRVSDLYINNEKPQVAATDNIKQVIMEMTSKRLGATAVLNADGDMVGIITDGDLRRMLMSGRDVANLTAADIMSVKPKTIDENAMAVNAFHLMEQNHITQLIVLKDGRYAGVIHIHDILQEGIV